MNMHAGAAACISADASVPRGAGTKCCELSMKARSSTVESRSSNVESVSCRGNKAKLNALSAKLNNTISSTWHLE